MIFGCSVGLLQTSPSPPDVSENRFRVRRGRQSPLAFAYGMRAVAILRLSTHIDWSTGEPSPM
jgi:hypothetical protein